MTLSETDRFALHYAARLLDGEAEALREAGTHPETGAWTDDADSETYSDMVAAAADLRDIATRHAPGNRPTHR